MEPTPLPPTLTPQATQRPRRTAAPTPSPVVPTQTSVPSPTLEPRPVIAFVSRVPAEITRSELETTELSLTGDSISAYEWRLENDAEWHVLDGDTMQLPTVDIGRHTLEIRGRDSGGTYSRILEHEFEVVNEPPEITRVGPSSSITEFEKPSDCVFEIDASDDSRVVTYYFKRSDVSYPVSQRSNTYRPGDLVPGKQYTVTMWVEDDDKAASAKVERTFSIHKNSKPMFDALELSPTKIKEGERVRLQVEPYDPDGDEVDTWYRIGTGSLNRLHGEFVWLDKSDGLYRGEHTIYVVIDDGNGGISKKELYLSVASPYREIRLTDRCVIELVELEGGTFTMIDHRDNRCTVHVDDFCIGKTEITQQHYEIVMGENPSEYPKEGNGDNYPVETVSWEQALEFCEKLSSKTGNTVNLPTEKQWEYACRAGSTTTYCYGDEVGRLEEYAWYNENSNRSTHPVAQLNPNDWGIYDMHGNIFEWCLDLWQNPYEENSEKPGTDKRGSRVIRGGSWCRSREACPSGFRYHAGQARAYYHVGFRIVMNE